MSVFAGFPSGKVSYTSLPDLFFSELLPQIDHLAELKVTLHVFWLLYHKKGNLRYVTLSELLGDGTLLRGLHTAGSSPPEEALREGLQRAVARGTLLHLRGAGGDGEQFYFVNSVRGRQAVEKVQLGEVELVPGGVVSEPVVVEHPNIFVLYEQNIGLLQPIIAEELRDAEETYPPQWIEEAFRIAVEQNVRNWKYIRRILERWAAEGKDKRREKTWYTEEESRKFIKR